MFFILQVLPLKMLLELFAISEKRGNELLDQLQNITPQEGTWGAPGLKALKPGRSIYLCQNTESNVNWIFK